MTASQNMRVNTHIWFCWPSPGQGKDVPCRIDVAMQLAKKRERLPRLPLTAEAGSPRRELIYGEGTDPGCNGFVGLTTLD